MNDKGISTKDYKHESDTLVPALATVTAVITARVNHPSVLAAGRRVWRALDTLRLRSVGGRTTPERCKLGSSLRN